MDNILKLKEIIASINLDSPTSDKLNIVSSALEEELEELSFFAAKYKQDYKVNENFVKKTVEMLEESNERLKTTNDKLLKANYELSNSNVELERFAHIASHDLKTPLYNIIRFSGLLKRKLKDNTEIEINEYLAFIIDGGKKMKNLIEDVLVYSSLPKRNSSSDEFINLLSIIEEIKASISQYLYLKNGAVEILTPLPSFTGNRIKFFILFKNLIENGIKYNTSTVPIIKIYCKDVDDQCSIYIEDNGIGIEKEYHEIIFQMFKRLHNDTEYEGSGLGLATCKKIVEAYNGTITVECPIKKRTIFRIDFPSSMMSLSSTTM